MANPIFPAPFETGFRLIGGEKLNKVIAQDQVSSQDGITAHAGGGATNAYQLTAVINRVTTVTSANDSVKLFSAQPGYSVTVDNDGVNNMNVYPFGTDQIEDSTSPISVAPGEDTTFICPVLGKWYQLGNTLVNPLIIGPAPIGIGASKTLTQQNSGSTILLDTAAGSTATLPAATGSGNKYRFIVTTTASSNAHKILAASVSDFIIGNAVGHTAAGATLAFSSAAATNHSIQMPFAGTQPSGGFIGDYFNFTDVGANLWAVDGMYQAGTTATTPFSSATT